ncbi:hypothetical protein GCM10009793_36030 [Brachybacterium phenoliresistens]|uniref:Uncharacterized protein n=2 Tax=Brachybacterium phenoliresistens TaxID=396014 RepID=Z9JNV6_9MICO|nr:hypothetical protein BF93_09365 [Brachybacterium phenoliresistens]
MPAGRRATPAGRRAAPARHGRVLSVSVPPAEAAAIAREVLGTLGWRVRAQTPATLELERGRRGATILLGGLAGQALHLTAALGVAERPHGTDLRLVWDDREGRALGGSLGRRRAHRILEESLRALEEDLRERSLLLGVRELG